MKPQIRVHFTDFWLDFDPKDNLWLDILRQRYEPVSDPVRPEFLFHSCFGHRHLRHDCVRICILGENISPDFNVSDYACGFDHLVFEDRHFRLPLYRIRMGKEAYQEHNEAFFHTEAAGKKKFCNFLYSNARNAHPARERFFDLLGKYKPVDSGGGLRNNIGRRVDDKQAWQREYKFSIAFENSCKNGYTTEKIYDALCAHTIPIYWGNPKVAQDFNPARFINAHDFPCLEAVVDRVRELDENPVLYRDMLGQPWFVNGPPPLPQDDPDYTGFLFSIIEQGPVAARRTTRNGISHVYYWEKVCQAWFAPLALSLSKIQSRSRRLSSHIRGNR